MYSPYLSPSQRDGLYTDNGNLHQRVEYLPFGEEILSEHSKKDNFYSMYYFSAKGRDEESGFTHMGERYMNHMLAMFNGADKLQDSYLGWSPYQFALNNPIRFRDPTGMFVEDGDGNFHDWSGKYLGTDGKTDDKIYIVRDSKSQKTIKQNEKAGKTTDASSVQVAIKTSKTELTEALDVLDRTIKNGGFSEEGSVVTPDGIIHRAEKGPMTEAGVATVVLPDVSGNDNTSIHSHPTEEGKKGFWTPEIPGPSDINPKYKQNIIVGKFAPDPSDALRNRQTGAVFYNRNWDRIGTMYEKAMRKIVNFK